MRVPLSNSSRKDRVGFTVTEAIAQIPVYRFLSKRFANTSTLLVGANGERPLNLELAELDSIVARVKEGDARAFELLVTQCQRRVYRWSLAFAIDRDDAEDIVQEVFVLLLRHVGQYRGKGAFNVWLYRITRRAASRMRRTRTRRTALSAGHRAAPDRVIYETDPGGRVDREQLGSILRSIWESLPSRQRCVLDLVDIQDRTPQEAAEMLDLNPSTLRANLFKARRAVKAQLIAKYPHIAESYSRGTQ